jgi:hypothetical protein
MNDKNTLPSFVIKVRNSLSTILPNVKNAQDNKSYQTRRLDNAVQEGIYYLNQFPDYLRHVRLKSELEPNDD